MFHDFTPSAIGTHGQATTNHFAKGGQIGRHTTHVAVAALLETETTDDFVEDEKRTVLVAQGAKTVKKFWALDQEPVVGRKGLDDDRSNFATVLVEQVFNRFQIIERTDEGRGDGVVWNARAAGDTKRGQTAS